MRRLVACSGIALLLVGCESAPKKAEEASPPASAATAQAQPAPAPMPAPTPAPPPAPAAPAGPPPGQEPVTAAPQATRALFIRRARANFRATPGTNGRIVAVLRKGTRVEVLEARNQWYRVKLADGREGWIAESVAGATAD
jgi:uncharacterized protein YgiM (DUF1202 family)